MLEKIVRTNMEHVQISFTFWFNGVLYISVVHTSFRLRFETCPSLYDLNVSSKIRFVIVLTSSILNVPLHLYFKVH